MLIERCAIVGCGKHAVIIDENGKLYCPPHALERLKAEHSSPKNGAAAKRQLEVAV